MASSFAAQLNEIAARSTNELDLKAQKTAHSQSLIFEKRVAGSQDFDTIYQICLEGFEDLCRIDPRFCEFQRSLFSQHSKTQERDQMTASQNATLDTVIEACLGLLGGRLLLSPAVKVAEWLVRRFRVHEYNTSFLLFTLLPYHAAPIFRNLLSILPSLPPRFKLLGPYLTTFTNPPRHAIAYGAINNDSFFAAFNTYVLKVCHAGSQHQTLLSFWASITAEAVAGRLDLSKSGRKEIQQQRQEDVLLKILPVLKDGLSMHESAEMIIACYTMVMILANKSLLADKLVNGLMETVVGALNTETLDAGLICLSVLTQQKSEQILRWKIVAKVADVHNIELQLQALNKSLDFGAFVLAMIQSALSNMQGKRQNERLDFVERLLFAEVMDPPRIVIAIGLLMKVLKSAEQGVISDSVRNIIVILLRKLNDSDTFSSLIVTAVTEVGLELDAVEATLQSMIRPLETAPADTGEMDFSVDTSVETQSSLSQVLEHLPQRTVDEHSFLSNSPSHLFTPLLDAFKRAAGNEEGLQLFSNLPLWKTSADSGEPLFASFFMRVFCGPYSVQIRYAALKIVGERLSELSDFDSQVMLPYILIQLSDPSQKIRKAASVAIVAMTRAPPSAVVDGELFKKWDAHELYGPGKYDQSLTILPTKDVSKIIQRAIIPILEECVMEPTQIKKALGSALKPTTGSDRVKSNHPSNEMKKSLRQSFFRLFLIHLLPTPLYSVKIGLLRLLTDVDRVGTASKRKELMPLLLDWASLTSEKVEKLASSEDLNIRDMNSAICGIISPADNDAVEVLLDLTSSSKSKRRDLESAVSEQIQSIWPRLNTERQVAATERLSVLIFDESVKLLDRSHMARNILQTVSLSTEVVIHLLSRVNTSINDIREHSPVSKKRRNNDNQPVAVGKSLSGFNLAKVREITFVLELVDTSSPEARPELLSGLFDVLTALHQLRVRDQSDLSYLLSLTIGSLLSIVRNAAVHTSKLELSAIPLDVIIDCMRATANAQVQNTALLLISALASIAPERVLNSIMPIFTLMGTSMLGKYDEYSNYVVDQTMDKVIPPLIESLRGRGQDLIAGTSELVSSFTVAYEHIPLHRRLRLFKKLVSNLGDETFLWAVVCRLTERYADEADIASFIISLINLFALDAQVMTCMKLVVNVQGVLASDPAEQTSTTGSRNAGDTGSPTAILPVLRVLDQIFNKSNMRSRMARLNQTTDNALPTFIPLCEDLLNRIISLVHTPNLDHVLSATANTVLSSLLSLLPLVLFIDITEHFAQTGPEIVRRKMLNLLGSRLRIKDTHSVATQPKAMSLLQVLLTLLKESSENISSRAAIACVDQICENYGRKDLPAVIQAARVISGHNCLGTKDRKFSTLALLCLSSMVELVKEAIVPVVPQLMPNVFDLLQSSLDEGIEDTELHNAAFTLIAGLLAHVSFIFSDDYLDRIMMFSAESRNAELGTESDEIRKQALQLVCKNNELSKIISSLQRTWSVCVENDISAVQQSLSLFGDSVKKSSKSGVIKYSDKIWAFILEAFDLRRIQFTNRTEDSYSDADVAEIEKTINPVAIEVVYKLNDTTFRPLFLGFMDWATKCQDIQSSNLSKAQELRQTSFFNFLAHFFNTLKSIVTSYATHMVEPALSVLKEISTASSRPTSTDSPKAKSKSKSKHQTPPSPSNPKPNPDTLPLYLATLHALQAALSHDSDGHFSTPSLFTPLSQTLTAQLHLASHPTFGPSTSPTLIRTLASLATAVLDTTDHLKSLNRLICALRHSDDAKVRLASVNVHLALSGADVIGENTAPPGERGTAGAAAAAEDSDVAATAAVAEEWCTAVLSVGEGMVYVNEMLEDEDEAVERGVRRLVRRVRAVVGAGEGIFE